MQQVDMIDTRSCGHQIDISLSCETSIYMCLSPISHSSLSLVEMRACPSAVPHLMSCGPFAQQPRFRPDMKLYGALKLTTSHVQLLRGIFMLIYSDRRLTVFKTKLESGPSTRHSHLLLQWKSATKPIDARNVHAYKCRPHAGMGQSLSTRKDMWAPSGMASAAVA